MALDFGLRQIGVAVGNRLLGTTRPLPVIRARDGRPEWRALEALVEEWRPDLVVVGDPLHMDGSDSAMSARAARFARQLEGRFRLPVYRVDERYSTTEALAAGARDADAASACIILEQFLRSIP